MSTSGRIHYSTSNCHFRYFNYPDWRPFIKLLLFHRYRLTCIHYYSLCPDWSPVRNGTCTPDFLILARGCCHRGQYICPWLKILPKFYPSSLKTKNRCKVQGPAAGILFFQQKTRAFWLQRFILLELVQLHEQITGECSFSDT